jgi:hypothetical protein
MTRPNEPSVQETQTSPNVVPLRRMTMTPLEPRTKGGLKGWGFTIRFDNITNEHPVEPATTSIPHKGGVR